MLRELDQVIEEARAGVYRNGALAATEPGPTLSPVRAPEPEPARPAPELRPVEPELPPEPEPETPAVVVSAYSGDEESEGPDRTAEALLRATQMAVTGEERDAIVAALQADFPGVDAAAITDEILG